MALISDLIETKPSSFKEVVEKLVSINYMVEEYDSILRNGVLKVVPRTPDKSMVCLRWLYKVKHVVDVSI